MIGERKLLLSGVACLVLSAFSLGILAQNPVTNPSLQPQFGAVQELTNCRVDLTLQAASVAPFAVCTLPNFSAIYTITCYVVTTQAATTSSTLPTCSVVYTDADSNVTETLVVTATSALNTLGQIGGTGVQNETISPKPGSVLQLQTSGYASSGATPMQYALHY